MTRDDLLALLPLIIIGYGAVVVLLVGAFWRQRGAVTALSLASMVASVLSAFAAGRLAPRQVTPLLCVDAFALSYMALFTLGGMAVLAFSHDYLGTAADGGEKQCGLVLFAVLGMQVLAASSHFVSFFVGLELLSVSLYGLIGYAVTRPASLEAGVKYLILAGAALAFLLLGLALLYCEFGAMEFGALRAGLERVAPASAGLVSFGLGLVVVAFGFKLAAVPFHTWAPDVYQGAPAPISALVATGSKAATFALLIRFASLLALRERAPLFALFEFLAIATMFGGNLLALFQRNLKRLLAYSSIAHMGYLFIPLLAGGAEGTPSIGFYFVSYFAATIAAFGVISTLTAQGVEPDGLESFRGLGLRRPFLAAVLALAMLSLAGIPLTVGFIGKLYIFAAAARAELWMLLVIGVVNSGLAAYYYLRVLAALYVQPASEAVSWPPTGRASAVCLAALACVMLVLGVYPSPLISLAQQVSVLAPPLP